MKIKTIPEDFIVNEITSIKPELSGQYLLCWMKKTELNTMQAIDYISRALNIPKKFVGFAGNKDKKAITKQLISIRGIGKSKLDTLSIDNLELTFYGYSKSPVMLGDLESNEFIITLREATHPEPKNKFINYFGKQRFSTNNAEIGKAIVTKKFKESIEMMGDGYHETKVREYLQKSQNNFIGALKQIDKGILRLYIHAYQSKLWNETATYCDENNIPLEDIPIIGFGTDIPEVLENFIKDLLKREQITERDFILPQMPELSAEGTQRKLYMETTVDIQEKDETIILKFALPKGSYATEVIRQLF